MAGHASWVRSVAWHPCGKRVTTAGDDGLVAAWDVANGRAVSKLERAHRGFVAAVALDATTRTLATAGDDALVKLWDCR